MYLSAKELLRSRYTRAPESAHALVDRAVAGLGVALVVAVVIAAVVSLRDNNGAESAGEPPPAPHLDRLVALGAAACAPLRLRTA
jgi:hypothetical protein